MGFKLTKYSPAAGPRMRPRKPVSSGPVSIIKKRDRSLINTKNDLDRMIDSLDRDAIKSLKNKSRIKRMTPMQRKNKY